MLHFVTSYMKQNKSRKQTLESAQSGLEISFKCSWARHFSLKMPLSTQVHKWVPTNLMLKVTLQWIGIPYRGRKPG